MKLFETIFISTFLCLTSYGDSLSENDADTVLTNGEIYTANEKKPWASAIAIRDEEIVFVGDDDEINTFVGPNTLQYDLAGKQVIPGLIDAHTHPGMVAITVGQVLIESASNRNELIKAVTEMVTQNPGKAVLMGGYWSNDLFGETGPHKRDLDKIESDRPVILYDNWGHSVWTNSKALEMADVNRDTKDIVPGFSFYQRDENGEPTGWITESAASVFVNKFQSVKPKVQQSLLEFLTYLRNLGVTTVLDAGNFGLDNETFAAVARLDKDGLLPVRYHGAYTLFLPSELSTAVDTLKKLAKRYNSHMVRIDTLKIFLDGVIETRTADMSDEYLDTPGNSGSSLLNQNQLHQLILDLNSEGLNLHVHTVGNRAVKTMLNAVEDAHESLSAAPRITITLCHLEVVDDIDFNRFKDLSVIASFTPQWHGADGDEGLFPAIGDKAHSMMRAQPMLSDGAVVTFSSDITDEYGWKGDRANPYLGMQIGHNRQDVEGGVNAPRARPQSERLQLDDLLNGYTRNAAVQLGRSEEIGSIQVGNRADLIVLNQNIFEVNRYNIHKTKPMAVFMDGAIVHGAVPRVKP